MDIAHLLRGLELIFPGIHNSVAANLVMFIRQENRTQFYDELNQQYETHLDQMEALINEVRVNLHELENEHLGKLKITLREVDQQFRSLVGKPREEVNGKFPLIQKLMSQSSLQSVMQAEKEHKELKKNLEKKSFQIISSYRDSAKKLVQKYN